MRTIELEGVEHTIECNAFTPFVYAENFTCLRDGRTVPEDINAAVDEVIRFQKEHSLPPMLKLLQFFWAFERTANPRVPSFTHWLHSLPRSAIALTTEGGWAKAVMDEINEAFFPDAIGEDVAPEGTGEPAPPAR